MVYEVCPQLSSICIIFKGKIRKSNNSTCIAESVRYREAKSDTRSHLQKSTRPISIRRGDFFGSRNVTRTQDE